MGIPRSRSSVGRSDLSNRANRPTHHPRRQTEKAEERQRKIDFVATGDQINESKENNKKEITKI